MNVDPSELMVCFIQIRVQSNRVFESLNRLLVREAVVVRPQKHAANEMSLR